MNKKLVVTGGLGFIGSHFVRMALEREYFVVNIDKQTYAARKDLDFEKFPNYRFIKKDICNVTHLPSGTDHVVNFAAESHVDNSIVANKVFFESNTCGVYNLLEIIRAKEKRSQPILLHISTDEVYGPIIQGSFTESDRLMPSSPYSATKAAADQLILAWGRTYGIQYKICRSANNYGCGQYPEKLFSKTFNSVLGRDRKMTVHGDGSFTREWLFVKDNCEAIFTILEKGTVGEIYNVSSNEEYRVIDVVRMIIRAIGRNPDEWVEFTENRHGQDGRYSVDITKIKNLGWQSTMSLKEYIPIYLDLYKKYNKPTS